MKKPAVLIIDDDPSHLRIYGWIVQSAGFESVSALVTYDAVDLPDADIDLVLLDYHLHGRMSATDVAKLLRHSYERTPIYILSDAMMMPDDIRPFVDGFIRKGDPARLVETITERLRKVA
jgi:DNA-binding response OmpR family regulator